MTLSTGDGSSAGKCKVAVKQICCFVANTFCFADKEKNDPQIPLGDLSLCPVPHRGGAGVLHPGEASSTEDRAGQYILMNFNIGGGEEYSGIKYDIHSSKLPLKSPDGHIQYYDQLKGTNKKGLPFITAKRPGQSG